MKRICVFCGSSAGNRSEYRLAAERLGQILLKRGVGLVYGGGDVGLMGMIAHTVFEGGGEVIGVIPRALAEADRRFDERRRSTGKSGLPGAGHRRFRAPPASTPSAAPCRPEATAGETACQADP